jgi:hypothetical protein
MSYVSTLFLAVNNIRQAELFLGGGGGDDGGLGLYSCFPTDRSCTHLPNKDVPCVHTFPINNTLYSLLILSTQ